MCGPSPSNLARRIGKVNVKLVNQPQRLGRNVGGGGGGIMSTL